MTATFVINWSFSSSAEFIVSTVIVTYSSVALRAWVLISILQPGFSFLYARVRLNVLALLLVLSRRSHFHHRSAHSMFMHPHSGSDIYHTHVTLKNRPVYYSLSYRIMYIDY